jgi:SAM-dependent methyltransferase
LKVCVACGQQFVADSWRCPSCQFTPELRNGYLAFSPESANHSPGFKSEHFAELAGLESKHFWFRARNRLITWALRRYFPDAKNFLEVGCGTGFVLSGVRDAFPGIALYGSEVYASGLDYASRRAKSATLFQMDARKIPFDSEFDVIGAFDVLEHIDQDQDVLCEMHRACVTGGGIVLTVPQHNFLWSQHDEYACHVRRYNVADLKKKVLQAGFSLLRTTSFVSLLLPFLIISRLRKRQSSAASDALDEYRIGAPVNAMLELALGLERTIIRWGVSFPAGGSLLVVARKG